MKKIAVFCALPPDRNTGMATVDLAAVSVLRRLAPEAEITLYAYGKVPGHSYQPGYLPYGYLDVCDHEAQYLASDIFVFWGDFTHSRSYWKIDRGVVEANVDAMAEAERAAWYEKQFASYSKYVFPQERAQDVVVFGSTIITNEASDELDRQYYETMQRFFAQVKAVYFRDALSAAKISPLRGNEASLGCDCALLLRDEDLKQITGFVPAAQRKGVGVFFGRSPRKARMMVFSQLVGRALGEKCRWLPWLGWGGAPKDRWPYMALGYKIRAADADTGALLSQLSGYKYIVSDTYHVCVNAWRMGIPAVCIGEGSKMALHSLGDKKKEILFEMYGARAFYVYLETLKVWKNLRMAAKHAAAALGNDALSGQVKANIGAHQQMALARLGDALSALLRKA